MGSESSSRPLSPERTHTRRRANVLHHGLSGRAQGAQSPACLAGSVFCVRLAFPLHLHVPETYAHVFFSSNVWRWVPLSSARACSLLLPLNVCRKDKYYLPWECENERHAYEKCVCIVESFLFPLILKYSIPDANTMSESLSTIYGNSPHV